MEEIFDVLKLCVSQGVQACNLGVPILKSCLVDEVKVRREALVAYDRQPYQEAR